MDNKLKGCDNIIFTETFTRQQAMYCGPTILLSLHNPINY